MARVTADPVAPADDEAEGFRLLGTVAATTREPRHAHRPAAPPAPAAPGADTPAGETADGPLADWYQPTVASRVPYEFPSTGSVRLIPPPGQGPGARPGTSATSRAARTAAASGTPGRAPAPPAPPRRDQPVAGPASTAAPPAARAAAERRATTFPESVVLLPSTRTGPAAERGTGPAASAGTQDRASTTNRAGTTGRSGTADRAGTTDWSGTADRAGTTDRRGTADRAGSPDRAGSTDRAGGTDRAGSPDRAGTTGRTGGTDRASAAQPVVPRLAGGDLFGRHTRSYAAEHSGQQVTILQAGCATAEDLDIDALRSAGARLGVSMIDEDTEVTRATVARHENMRAATLGDLRTVPVPARAYDIVQCSGLLGRVENAELVLDRLSAAVKPGGLLLLRIRDRDSAAGFLDRVLPQVARRAIWRKRQPGEPGPHAAVYERLSTARGVQGYVLMHGLVIAERGALGGLAGGLNRGPYGYLAAQKLVTRLSRGRLTVAHEDLLYVIRKPEDAFARII